MVTIFDFHVGTLLPFELYHWSNFRDKHTEGSVSLWGQGRSHNLNAPATLYPLESSLARARHCAAAGRQAQADAKRPAKASTPERENSPRRETLSLFMWLSPVLSHTNRISLSPISLLNVTPILSHGQKNAGQVNLPCVNSPHEPGLRVPVLIRTD